jgi:uncharacterized protein (DUF2147 family)
MSRRLASLCAAVAAMACSTLPLHAGDRLSPIGSWQISTGEARYKVVSCGDGGQICAKLVWLRDDARTAQNLQYLNHYVVTGALPKAVNQWSGTVSYEGENIGGSMTMLTSDRMRLTGCKLFGCKTLEFTRL